MRFLPAALAIAPTMCAEAPTVPDDDAAIALATEREVMLLAVDRAEARDLAAHRRFAELPQDCPLRERIAPMGFDGCGSGPEDFGWYYEPIEYPGQLAMRRQMLELVQRSVALRVEVVEAATLGCALGYESLAALSEDIAWIEGDLTGNFVGAPVEVRGCQGAVRVGVDGRFVMPVIAGDCSVRTYAERDGRVGEGPPLAVSLIPGERMETTLRTPGLDGWRRVE